MNRRYVNNKDNASSYKLPDYMLDKYSKKLSVKKKVLSSIVFDSNIMFTDKSIFMNMNKITELEFMDYILDVRFQYN